jgi:hypothetical protein
MKAQEEYERLLNNADADCCLLALADAASPGTAGVPDEFVLHGELLAQGWHGRCPDNGRQCFASVYVARMCKAACPSLSPAR